MMMAVAAYDRTTQAMPRSAAEYCDQAKREPQMSVELTRLRSHVNLVGELVVQLRERLGHVMRTPEPCVAQDSNAPQPNRPRLIQEMAEVADQVDAISNMLMDLNHRLEI